LVPVVKGKVAAVEKQEGFVDRVLLNVGRVFHVDARDAAAYVGVEGVVAGEHGNPSGLAKGARLEVWVPALYSAGLGLFVERDDYSVVV